MKKHEIFFGLHRSSKLEGVEDRLTERARGALVKSVYARPTTLILGALNGVLSSTVVAFHTEDKLFFALTFLLSSIALLRVVTAMHLRQNMLGTSPRKVDVAYIFGALAYSLVLGLIAAATIAFELPPMAQVLMIANALGYGIGNCAHNGGRPAMALGQLVFVSTPVFLMSLTSGSALGIFLAINIAVLMPAMIVVTLSLFRVLRESIEAAEQSARLATKMELVALTDPITGLANRAGLDRRLPEILEAAREKTQVAVFWIDLDRFKDVNDYRGHQAGDHVLREIGSRLRGLIDGRGIAARFAGDEFVVASPVNNHRSASALANAILSAITRPIRIDGDRIDMEGSIGIALLPDDGLTASTLLKRADLALFEAKADGRKQIRFFDSSMTRDLARRREIEVELRKALRDDQLSVYFQPIIDLQTGRIRCFEALARWFHPMRGEIRPDEFIPIAEDSGAIVTLGNWLTAKAARAAATWPEDVRIAVNLSPLQIKVPGAAVGILSAIREAGLAPERLELEVTENLFLEDSMNIALFIEELSEAGVRFVLDDFGTGYSSLGYINQWPFSKIKVDRSFVSGGQAGTKSDAIIRAVSQMGRSLGMEIVAEGLETIDQVRAVREAGCTHGQGYHFSRAIPDYQAALLLAEEHDTLPEELHQRLAG
ncbi:putative bifunctional diguanylate cyclase/phosphodiesterase [Erythrobacter mangrovi]|uniref:EAL domain-containing protein n=1 Tax=Erythrobacter mangrovi TaxID=2739433 RepID=A0A7D4B8I0_9SPHN|nr:EAL domain-containing protein [Erythrobacter mangrovi]QKG71903.1 EAL domain-containing protein [Erythrobacter mangrovi]